MGMYETPYERFGMLGYQMARGATGGGYRLHSEKVGGANRRSSICRLHRVPEHEIEPK